MKRTQLYLDDQLWDALHARARDQQTTISDLVRQAAREKYMINLDERRKAMQDFVGSRKRRSGKQSSVEEVRDLRSGNRLDTHHKR